MNLTSARSLRVLVVPVAALSLAFAAGCGDDDGGDVRNIDGGSESPSGSPSGTESGSPSGTESGSPSGSPSGTETTAP